MLKLICFSLSAETLTLKSQGVLYTETRNNSVQIHRNDPTQIVILMVLKTSLYHSLSSGDQLLDAHQNNVCEKISGFHRL